MAENSGISWTDHTFNPWIGCQRVSPACENCYAETSRTTLAMQATRGLRLWGPQSDRYITSEANWAKPAKWNRQAAKEGRRFRVFCASLADVFEDRRDLDEPRARLFKLIEETPHLDWLLLTKRPQHIVGNQRAYPGLAPQHWREVLPSNVWIGTTAEDAKRLRDRVLWLIDVPASVLFLSIEPQQEPLNLRRIDVTPVEGGDFRVLFDALTGHMIGPDEMHRRVSWVITGGESGPNARSYDPEWARDIVRQCREAGAAPFVKQLGKVWAKTNGAKHPAGADPAEWPEDLRVQEFPEAP
jgi:protein gp37